MLVSSIINILFPHYCFSCRKIGPPLCPRCAQNITYSTEVVEHHAGIDGLYACFSYTGVVKNTIRAGKYFSVRDALAVIFSYIHQDQLCAFIKMCQKHCPTCVLVPVPIHHRRYAERGFNQSEVIAMQLRLIVHMQVCTNLVIRHRYTSAQAQLHKKARQKNLRDAFTYCGDTQVVPKGVILVDDVWTTGSTIREVARVLKGAGVTYVWAVTLAR